jgi:hypothetical protein
MAKAISVTREALTSLNLAVSLASMSELAKSANLRRTLISVLYLVFLSVFPTLLKDFWRRVVWMREAAAPESRLPRSSRHSSMAAMASVASETKTACSSELEALSDVATSMATRVSATS